MSKMYHTPKNQAHKPKIKEFLKMISIADWLSAIGITVLLMLTGFNLLSKPSLDSLVVFLVIAVQGLDFVRSVTKKHNG